jgi:hypothetical protein
MTRMKLSRCVCGSPTCPLRWTPAPCFLAPAAALFWRTGSLVRSLPAAFIFVTSVAKYNFDVLHAVDLATVAVCTPATFALNPVAAVPFACLAWNVVVFAFASRRSCAWHATIHVSTGVALLSWAKLAEA